MTTPRIEEMVEEFISTQARYQKKEVDGKTEFVLISCPSKDTVDWLRQALTQARQAGVDETMERIKNCIEVKSDTEIWISPEKLDDTIKALQDNK